MRLFRRKVKIIDVIDRKHAYGVQRFLVLNKMPDFVYERQGRYLIAEDSGFYNFYGI